MLHKIIAANKEELVHRLSDLIEKISNTAIKDKNSFYIGFSGGSLVKFLISGLPNIKTDFAKWKIFFCDERVVPINSPDSTFGLYKNELLCKVPIEENQFVQIKQGVSARDAADDYIEKLKDICDADSMPRFDMLLLGMGPDGHTCSLFPNHPVLKEKQEWVMPVVDSPKPPPERITLTYPVINNAKNCVFALSGAEKADIVKRILIDKEDFPSTRVEPKNGDLYWILDQAAASRLTN